MLGHNLASSARVFQCTRQQRCDHQAKLMMGRKKNASSATPHLSGLERAKVLKVVYTKIWLQLMGNYKRVRVTQC